MTMPIHVIDPFSGPPADPIRCECQLYPNADEVVFCTEPAVAMLAAPCCGRENRWCFNCLNRGAQLRWWQCHGCGVRTDCTTTPMIFDIRWLR